MSQEVKDLLSHMLTREKNRFSAKEVLQHPWFALCEKMEGKAESAAKQTMVQKALMNLEKFSTRNKLKQHALGYLVQHFMQVSESEELEQVFQALDTSGEGFLTKKELMEGYRKYYGHNFNEKEIESLMHMADQTEDGRIGYSEFVLTTVDRDKFLTLEKLEAMFMELDTDGNHMITFDEIKQILGGAQDQVPLEALEDAFADVDPQGRGQISFGQFKLFIQNLLA